MVCCAGAEFKDYNVLDSEEIRQGIKDYRYRCCVCALRHAHRELLLCLWCFAKGKGECDFV